MVTKTATTAAANTTTTTTTTSSTTTTAITPASRLHISNQMRSSIAAPRAIK